MRVGGAVAGLSFLKVLRVIMGALGRVRVERTQLDTSSRSATFMSQRPLVAITMGDAAGIGAEVTAKALQDEWVFEKCRPFVVGSTTAMNTALDLVGAPSTARVIHDAEDASGNAGSIDVLDLENLDFGEIEYGKVSACSRVSRRWSGYCARGSLPPPVV